MIQDEARLLKPSGGRRRSSERREAAPVELVDDTADFFAPVTADVIDGLVGQYENMRRKLEAVAELATGEQYRGALAFFIEGNASEVRRDRAPSVAQLFDLEGAIAALNAHYWGRALELTDVYECMPQKRRNEWNEQLRNPRGVKARGLRGEAETWAQEPLPHFEVNNPALLEFVATQYAGCKEVLSVCTGTFILHAAGILPGKSATTHWGSLERLQALGDVRVVQERFVRDGNIWSSAGVSAGIDLMLAFIAEKAGDDAAGKVQFSSEYYPSPRTYGGYTSHEKAPAYIRGD